jgi:hypothetical protein
MAIFSYTTGYDSTGFYIEYTVTGLQYTWGSGAYVTNPNGYNHFGLGSQPFTSGKLSWVFDYDSSYIKHQLRDGYTLVYPSTTETAKTGTTTLNGWARINSSMYIYPYLGMNGPDGTTGILGTMWGVTETGSVSSGTIHPGIYIEVKAPAVRPGFFYWSTYGGEPSNSQSILWIPKAAAWNGLRSNIAQLLAYKGLISSAAAFNDSALPTVSKGTLIKASMYNQAVYYINYMLGANYLSYVTAGSTPMYMYYWYQLQQYLNGIA